MPYVTRQVAPNGSLLILGMVEISKGRHDAIVASGGNPPNGVRVSMMIDTGASSTCVDPTVLKALNLTPTGSVSVQTPSTSGNPVMLDQYDVGLTVFAHVTQHPLKHEYMPVICSELQSQGFQVLLGRDVLSGCLLNWDGLGGSFSLAY